MKLLITIILIFNTSFLLSQDTIVQLDTFSSMTWNQFVQKRFEILKPLHNLGANMRIPDIEITNNHIHYLCYSKKMHRGSIEYISMIEIDSSKLTFKEKNSIYNNNLDTTKTYFYQYTTDFESEWDSIIPALYIGSYGGSFLLIRIDYGKVRYIFNSRAAHTYTSFDNSKYIINNNYITEDFELIVRLLIQNHEKSEKERMKDKKKRWKWRKRKGSN